MNVGYKEAMGTPIHIVRNDLAIADLENQILGV